MKGLKSTFKKIWKLVVLYLLIIITFSYAMFQGGFVSWFLFYSFLPFAIYALFLSLFSLNQFEATRVFQKGEFNAGETLKVKIKLRRRTSFPLFYLLIEDCLSDQLRYSQERNRAKTFLFPWFKKEMLLEFEIHGLLRGEHHFGAIRLKTGDPLGLIEKEIHVQTNQKIIVYPAYEELIYRPLDNHYDQGMTASKERVQRDTSVAVGIREYQPGDRFSWINWKATAKRNDIMTKEFEQRQSHDVFILMDCAPSSSFEAIVSFSACLARAILQKGAQVGFLSSSAERIAIPIRGGENQLIQLFYHLAKVRDNSPVPIDRVIEAEGFQLQKNILMLITAQLTRNVMEKAGLLTSKNGTVTIFIVKNEMESLSQNELSLKAAASARGIRVVLVHNGNFKAVFSEVARS